MNLFRPLGLTLSLACVSFAQGEGGETFFHEAKVGARLIGKDSLIIIFSAGSEDLQNTVGIFPYENADSSVFRLFENKMEAYLQERLPVFVDGKRLYPKIVQWKTGGKGRGDRLDSADIYVDAMFFGLGTRLPPHRKYLELTANVWTEREDAGNTLIQFTLIDDDKALRHVWTGREKKVRFPISADSLAYMRKHPPGPVRKLLPRDIPGH